MFKGGSLKPFKKIINCFSKNSMLRIKKMFPLIKQNININFKILT